VSCSLLVHVTEKPPASLFFPRALVVAQKRSFTVLAGHVHSRPRTRRPALLFLMTACQKTGADFHGPRQLLGSLRLAASATGEQWTLTGNLARLAGRSVRGRATNARVTRPPRRAPPPQRLAWPAGRKSRTLARPDQSCIRAGRGSRIARPSHHRAARVGRRRRAGERESTSTSSGRLPRVLE